MHAHAHSNNWFLASKFERVLHCHYTLEWSRAMCLFPQIKCFCSDSYWNKVQYDWVNGRVAWRLTYSKDVNVIVVPSPFFPTMLCQMDLESKQTLSHWNSHWQPGTLLEYPSFPQVHIWSFHMAYLWSSKAGQLFCCFQSLPANYM